MTCSSHFYPIGRYAKIGVKQRFLSSMLILGHFGLSQLVDIKKGGSTIMKLLMFLCALICMSAMVSRELKTAYGNNISQNNFVIIIGSKVYFQNGVARQLDETPYILYGTTMVPVEFIEAMGAEVDVDKTTQIARISTENIVFSNPFVMTNKNKIFLPLRLVSEALHLQVTWVESEKKVLINPIDPEKFYKYINENISSDLSKFKLNYYESDYWIQLTNEQMKNIIGDNLKYLTPVQIITKQDQDIIDNNDHQHSFAYYFQNSTLSYMTNASFEITINDYNKIFISEDCNNIWIAHPSHDLMHFLVADEAAEKMKSQLHMILQKPR